jgi:hypothetical protein
MAKSRGRPEDRRPTGGGTREPSKLPFPLVSGVWTLFIAIGSAGGTFSLLDKGYNFFLPEPEIRAPLTSTDPFLLPFSIKNSSAHFAMYEIQWICSFDDVKQGNGRIAGISFTGTGRTTIAPGATTLAQCGSPGIRLPSAPAGQSTVTAIVKYKMLRIIPRENNDFSFTWLPDAQPPHWEPGRFVK